MIATLRVFATVIFIVLASPALAITGVWYGTLQGQGGAQEVSFKFSPSGYPILQFEGRNGPKEFEATQVGEKHEWLLPGRGWGRCRIEALQVTPERVQLVVSLYKESGGGSLMNQTRKRMSFVFVQAGAALRAGVMIEDESYGSGSGVGLYAGAHSKQIFQGALSRR